MLNDPVGTKHLPLSLLHKFILYVLYVTLEGKVNVILLLKATRRILNDTTHTDKCAKYSTRFSFNKTLYFITIYMAPPLMYIPSTL